jgi:hypothetical protein
MFEMFPGVGLGPLRFGMSEAEIEDILGKPEDSTEFDSDRHSYYGRMGIALFWGAEGGGALTGIEVDPRCRCTLYGQELFSKQLDEIVQLLRLNTQPAISSGFELTTSLNEDGTTRVACPWLDIDFYFDEDGLLESVNWSPLESFA